MIDNSGQVSHMKGTIPPLTTITTILVSIVLTLVVPAGIIHD